VLAVLARAGVIPAALLTVASPHMLMFPPLFHMIVVGAAGALAVLASVVMSAVAARRNDGRAVLLGMAFSTMATMLVIHALATPGVLVPANGVVQLAGVLHLPFAGAILAASGLPMLRRPRRVSLLLWVQGAVVAV